MPALATLSTTTFAEGVDNKSDRIRVASTSGMVPGIRLYANGELMTVLRIDVDPWVVVTRGVDSTSATPHSSGETIYVGRADQFYSSPPVGRPPSPVLVSPYIDAVAGKVYFAQGDNQPSATAVRWWQEQTTTYTPGSLGGPATRALSPTTST